MARRDVSSPSEALDAEEMIALASLPLHSTDLVTLLDEQGTVLYESPAIERLYGFDQDELVGEQVADYFHPADRTRVMEAFRAIVVADDLHVESVEYRHRQADGSYKWIETVGSSDPTPNGNYVVNSRDISERKQRERELQRTRQQVQSERDGKEAIRQLLVESSQVTAIADGVCRLLVETYGYEAAWIVVPTEESGDNAGVVWLASHGSDRGFRTEADETGWRVDAATRRCLDSDAPVMVAVDANDTTETDDADSEAAVADRLRACELDSVRSVPLDHDGVSYGALTVTRSDAESEYVGELVAEVAAALAFKQQVDRQQAALRAETVTELELRIPEGHVLAALAAAPSLPAEASLAVEELRHAHEELSTYLLKTGAVDGETLVGAASGLLSVREASVVTESDERVILQLRVDEPTVGAVVSGYGGMLQSTTASDGRVDVTVQFPRRTDVSQVVETVGDHWPVAILKARSERAVDTERPTPFGGLTRKQEDALRAATLAGFFERPQEASASEVAETLGVSSSTFLHHLRNAERKVFENAFGDGDE
jgi:PAS domain S-box-containing protein